MNTTSSGNSRMPFMQQQQANPLNLGFGQTSAQPFYASLSNPSLSFPSPGTAVPSMVSINHSLSSNNPMNDYLDQHMHPSQQSMNNQQMNNNNYVQSTTPDLSKSLGSLTVADLTNILQPIQSSIEDIKTTLSQQMGTLQTKVQVLENELKKEVAKNEQLTDVIVTMQKSLNMIDADKRVTNLIINGLPEEEMINEDIDLVDDKAKFKCLMHKIGIGDIDEQIDNFEFARIGIPAEGKKRVLKINVGTKDRRDKICKESKKVKLLPAPWKLVYINKDVHPVYMKENKRIRKKMQELKKVPGYEHESGRVKLENGMLTVDDAVVDQNLFFQI